MEQKNFERLPADVKPTLYNILLKPDLIDSTFDGTEVVHLKIVNPTYKITLNSLDLRIESAEVKLPPDDGESLPAEVSVSQAEELLTLTFPTILPAGNAEITIKFSGVLSDKMKGFYRCTHTQATREEAEKYLAVTQFCATDARRCFPCWDEPAIKARFNVTLVVDADKVALSNMPVQHEHLNETGSKVVQFQTTPVMSTYLLAFVIGHLEFVEDTSADGVLVRVYTACGKKDQGKFALHVATKVLPYYKEYFQIAYPLPKLDLVAIPELPFGAMENWGLITYKESCLLVDEENTSAATRQSVALIVGHECAHQWFGNLVTLEWWTHLWLNEGYASFVEFLCVAYLFPEYDIWSQFVTKRYRVALELDALRSSHSIEVPVNHPAEIAEIFDDISYNKGSSVIRMMHSYIGDEDFRKGMNLYLTRHQYGNTSTEDLWRALEEASHKPISTMMPTWTKQKGYPLVTVESSTQEENNIRNLVLSQDNFSAESYSGENNSNWLVPLSFCKESDPEQICHRTVLDGKTVTVSLPNIAPDEWIKINPGITGFYRTKYSTDLLGQLLPAVEKKTLPPLDRLGLLDDLFALVQIGQASTPQVLDLIQAMKEEVNYTIWANIAACLGNVGNLLMNTDFDHLFKAYGLKLMKPISEKLGYETKPDETHLDTLLRSLVLNQLVMFGDAEFLEVARRKFEDHCTNKSVIPADLRGVIYKAVISADGKAALDSLLDIYKNTNLQEEKERILRSFTAIRDGKLVDDVLEFTQSADVNLPSAVTAIVSTALSKAGRDKSWEFLKQNWDSIAEKYGGLFQLSSLVKYTTKNFTHYEKADEIETFFSGKDISRVERTLNQSLETIRSNSAWLQRDRDCVKAYLENFEVAE